MDGMRNKPKDWITITILVTESVLPISPIFTAKVMIKVLRKALEIKRKMKKNSCDQPPIPYNPIL